MTRDDAVEILTTAREMYPGKSVIRDAFTLALSAGQLVVGQVWDEALADVIAPGDRILSLDGHPWDGDVCRFLLDPDPLDGTVGGIGTASGQHVVLTIETMK